MITDRLKVLDLFSGIGGFSLGLERAGMETIAFCEIDSYCRQVLAKHWPDVPIHEDIRELDGNAVGPVDVICGGYPCQPFSTAGKRRGAQDDRHLWPEYLRLIRELRPAWIIGENVAGHISMGLDEVLADLERAGYTWEAFVIPACAVDAPHRRDRVWIIANAEHLRGRQEQISQRRGCDSAKSRNDGKSQSLADDSSNGRHKGRESLSETLGNGSIGESRWPFEPAVGRVANGIPRRVDRLRALGNAVVPQIPEVIGLAIIQLQAAAK